MQIYLILTLQNFITTILGTYFYLTYDRWRSKPALVTLVSSFKHRSHVVDVERNRN
jgi:hypothetical protein